MLAILFHNINYSVYDGIMNTCDIRFALQKPTASKVESKYIVIEMCQNQYSRSIKFVWLQTITSFH